MRVERIVSASDHDRTKKKEIRRKREESNHNAKRVATCFIARGQMI